MGAGAAGTWLYGCASWRQQRKTIPGEIIGANSRVGHILRDGFHGEVSGSIYHPVIIVGGGIGGLTAGWKLQRSGFSDYCILELDDAPGGNARWGQNAVSAYPWGAHYLPIPNLEQPDMLRFLEEQGVITGYQEGKPVYREEYLCQEPEERLFIHGYWQEGLVPEQGLAEADKEEIKRFFALVDHYRGYKGTDGRYAFDIPLAACSADEAIWQLDTLRFSAYLEQEGYTSSYLHWYLDYCMRDDYGTTLNEVSAWAGLHYFASRRGIAANAGPTDVLTWPEGNGFLASRLAAACVGQLRTGQLVLGIRADGQQHVLTVLDTTTGKATEYRCDELVLATPGYVMRRWNYAPLQACVGPETTYSPWLVANITVKNLPQSHGAGLSWDNVIYGSASLGYVNACHQRLEQHLEQQVLTFYKPLLEAAPTEMRRIARERSHTEWVDEVLKEMHAAHPRLEKYTERMDIWIWGHAMPQPVPGVVRACYQQLQAAEDTASLHYAHSDRSGFSIFEEAFYHGCRAAERVLTNLRAHA